MDEGGAETAPATPTAAGGPRYAAHFRVRYYECDLHGHVHNTVYLHYLEQAAHEHSEAAGYPLSVTQALGGVWIVRRHEVDYLRPATADETLRVVTWAEEFRGARAFRRYAVYRLPPGADATNRFLPPDDAPPDEPLVEARTLWVWFDLASGRPRRVPPEMHAAFFGPHATGEEQR